MLICAVHFTRPPGILLSIVTIMFLPLSLKMHGKTRLRGLLKRMGLTEVATSSLTYSCGPREIQIAISVLRLVMFLLMIMFFNEQAC